MSTILLQLKAAHTAATQVLQDLANSDNVDQMSAFQTPNAETIQKAQQTIDQILTTVGIQLRSFRTGSSSSSSSTLPPMQWADGREERVQQIQTTARKIINDISVALAEEIQPNAEMVASNISLPGPSIESRQQPSCTRRTAKVLCRGTSSLAGYTASGIAKGAPILGKMIKTGTRFTAFTAVPFVARNLAHGIKVTAIAAKPYLADAAKHTATEGAKAVLEIAKWTATKTAEVAVVVIKKAVSTAGDLVIMGGNAIAEHSFSLICAGAKLGTEWAAATGLCILNKSWEWTVAGTIFLVKGGVGIIDHAIHRAALKDQLLQRDDPTRRTCGSRSMRITYEFFHGALPPLPPKNEGWTASIGKMFSSLTNWGN